MMMANENYEKLSVADKKAEKLKRNLHPFRDQSQQKALLWTEIFQNQ